MGVMYNIVAIVASAKNWGKKILAVCIGVLVLLLWQWKLCVGKFSGLCNILPSAPASGGYAPSVFSFLFIATLCVLYTIKNNSSATHTL